MDASFCDIGGESRTDGGRYIVEASYNCQTTVSLWANGFNWDIILGNL